MQRYKNLYILIEQDPEAAAYYRALPAYVRDQMGQRAADVNSFASMRDYAENLLRGDD